VNYVNGKKIITLPTVTYETVPALWCWRIIVQVMWHTRTDADAVSQLPVYVVLTDRRWWYYQITRFGLVCLLVCLRWNILEVL